MNPLPPPPKPPRTHRTSIFGFFSFTNTMYIIMVLLLGASLIYSQVETVNMCKFYDSYIEHGYRSVLYDVRNKHQTITNGVYFPNDDYYCVYTGGRNIEAINTTEYHEACHALIDREPYHFCNNSCAEIAILENRE